MKKLLVYLAITSAILAGCKDKRVDRVEDIETPEQLPLPMDTDLVKLSPDLEAYLIKNKIDNQPMPNGRIEYGNIKNVDSLDLYFIGENKSLEGLQYFTNLRYLKFASYQVPTNDTNRFSWAFPAGVIKQYKAPIDTLDVRHNLNLEYLDVSGSSNGGGYSAAIGFLKLGKNEKLKTLKSQFGMMNTMDLSGLTNLENLDIVESYSLKTVSLCSNLKLQNLRSWQVEKFYVADPGKVNANWPGQTGGAKFLKCE